MLKIPARVKVGGRAKMRGLFLHTPDFHRTLQTAKVEVARVYIRGEVFPLVQ